MLVVRLEPEVRHDVDHAIPAGLEMLTTTFGQRRLHANAELPLHRVLRPVQRHDVTHVRKGRRLGLIRGIGSHTGRWQWRGARLIQVDAQDFS